MKFYGLTSFWISCAVILSTLIVSPKALSAKQIKVCQTCFFKNIPAALAGAVKGDAIIVAAGDYNEPIVIDKSVRLVGEGMPRIDGKRIGHVVAITAPDVALENFIISGSGMSDRQEFAGVYVQQGLRCRIAHNRLEENTYGIYLADSSNCTIANNTIAGNAVNEVTAGNGIHFWKTEDMVVEDNFISNHRDGIYIEFSHGMRISRNVATHNIRYGLHFMYANGNEFYANTFVNNETGVAIMYSRKIVVKENIFAENWGLASYGLLLKDIMDSDFHGNRYFNNTIAVFADNSNRNRFAENQFEKNGFALQILGNCENNAFNKNIFRSNFFDVGINSRDNSNTFAKNYWDHYTGYDLDRDGFGDVPFRPVRVFSYWLTRYNALAVLMLSPALEFLEISERAFPVITPSNLVDASPAMLPAIARATP